MDSSESLFLGKYKYFILIIGIGIIVYFNGLFGPFFWDDRTNVLNNTLLHNLSNIPSFFVGGSYTSQSTKELVGLYYRPLLTTIFSFIYALSGSSTFLYHLIQLAIHITNCIFIFVIFKKILKKELLAFTLSLIFLVHPLNVEAVSWIGSLIDPLFFFFGILAFYISLKDKLSVKRTFFIGLLILCSIFIKETGIVFVALIFSYRFIFKKNYFLKLSLAFFVPVAIYLYLRFFVAKIFAERIPDVPMMTAPIAQRIFTMPAIFLHYLKLFIFPRDLFIYQEWSVLNPDINFYFPLFIDILICLGIFILGFWIYKKRKDKFTVFLFFTSWFFIGILPHLQIVPLDFTVSDRWFYFPMVGLIGMIGSSVLCIKNPSRKLQIISFYTVLLIIVLFGVRTVIRNANWGSEITLYSHDLKYQQNDRLENLLAMELFNEKDYKDAQYHLQKILDRNPNQAALYVNLALTYEFEGNVSKAIDIYKKGLSFDDSGAIYTNYLRVLLSLGKFEEGKKIAEEGLSKFPQYSTLWILDAVINYKLKDKNEALIDIQKAKGITNDPRFDQIYQEIQNNTLNL